MWVSIIWDLVFICYMLAGSILHESWLTDYGYSQGIRTNEEFPRLGKRATAGHTLFILYLETGMRHQRLSSVMGIQTSLKTR